MRAALLRAIQWLLGAALAAAGWVHSWTARPLVEWWDDTVLGTWEESLKSVIREAFVQTNNGLNAVASWLLTLTSREYREGLRDSWTAQQDWHSWWREERTSTLNAVIARHKHDGERCARCSVCGLCVVHCAHGERES
jgi:hypothetical protein